MPLTPLLTYCKQFLAHRSWWNCRMPPIETRKEPCESLWRQQRSRTLNISLPRFTTNDLREAGVLLCLKDSHMPQPSSEVWYSLHSSEAALQPGNGHLWVKAQMSLHSLHCVVFCWTVMTLRASQKKSLWMATKQRDNTSLTEGWDHYLPPPAPAML